MKSEFYPDIKKLTGLPEWKTFEALLERERQLLIAAFENGPLDKLAEARNKIEELKKVMRLPHDLVKEHEARQKAQ